MVKIIKKVGLSDRGQFLKISDENTSYYGGDQDWFHDSIYRKVGCGAIAASNITAYLSNKHKTLRNLYPYKMTASREEYVKHMNEVVQYIQPNEQLGVPSLLYWKEQLETFAKTKNVLLKSKWISNLVSYEEMCNFIEEGLTLDSPIALLMFRNPKLPQYDWHWMTLTEYEQDVENDRRVTISTWGEKKQLNLRYVHQYSAYSALIYFYPITS